MVLRLLVFMTLTTLCGACGSSQVTPIAEDTQARLDTAPSSDTQAGLDVSSVDSQDPAAEEVLAPECLEGEGCFGEACDGPDDCLGGICTSHIGEKVCSKTCDAQCPAGFSCTLVGSAGSDGQYVCMSNAPTLCLPCETAEGCAGDSPAACVRYGNGMSFCGATCDLDRPCPQGYACQETETTTGASSYQCVATSGECSCSSIAVKLGLATGCKEENPYGVCLGQRICGPDGLQVCDAAVPAEEVCNGIDDDCDGNTDEATCDDGNACTEDACAGESGCNHTPLDAGECLDGDACTIGDHCEGGNCVGQPIVCDDNNFCTQDVCNETGGCESVAIVKP